MTNYLEQEIDMKVGRDYSWWVSYTWEYEYLNRDEAKWESYCDYDSGRFDCRKKDIKKTVTEYVKNLLYFEKYRNLNVTINDAYMTTTEEV